MQKGRTFHREHVYVTGDYLDGDIYPVFQPAGKRRRRCKASSRVQAALNQKNAEKKLTRLAHANFTDSDLALHLTYGSGREPESIDDAERLLGNFIKRLRRRYKKAGLTLKYIRATERGSKNGRIHHHLLISGGIDRDEIEKLWGLGYANSQRLQFDAESGITGLSHYMAKERQTYRRWSGSRNLTIPEPYEQDGRLSRDDMQELAEEIEDGTAWRSFEALYPDFRLTEATVERNIINQGIYIRFSMRRRFPWEYRTEARRE